MPIPADPLSHPLPEIPISITPLIGWRGIAFGETAHEVGPRIYESVEHIRSPMLGHLWPKGRLSWDGVCRCRAQIEVHDVIDYVHGNDWRLSHSQLVQLLASELCRCGINAFSRRRHLLGSEYGAQPMIAEVALWGEVRLFAKGMRAEHAQILRVFSTRSSSRDRVRQLCEREGIEYAGHISWWSKANLPLRILP